jgi:nucleoside-diphosphate-sugar epimerase
LKLLVTGAHGFTGRHFVKAAQMRGYEVVGLQTDLKDATALKKHVVQLAPEFVVHLAAISFVGHIDTSAFYKVNVIGTLNLLEALAALKNPPRAVLLASSANVYGNCEQSPITEAQLPIPVNHYAMSKLAMEYMAKTYLDRLPLFFARPFNYTGHGQSESFVIPKLVAHFAKQANTVELGNVDVEREFNDVRFVCAAYLRLLEKASSGEIYNVCTNKPITLTTVIKLLSNITGHHLNIKVNKAFVRSNEIQRLCGDPAKLLHTIGVIESPTLLDTLQWMLTQ